MRKIEKLIDKEALISSCDKLFDSALGKKAEAEVRRAILENNMLSLMKTGVAIGLSGGADSVLLSIILRNLQKEYNFNVKALHVNHMIRGGSADRDELFSRELAEALGFEFEALRIDVPSFALENKLGTEEAARKIRYDFFAEVISKNENLRCIATAHNSTDNLETFIFNFMRGSGTNGLSGIAPVRDNVIRPLIYVSKEDILKLLTDAEIPFVTDETNFSVEYTRNYIRHEILPKLKRLSPHPEDMSNKAISNLRSDADYISTVADKFYNENRKHGKISSDLLREQHPAVFSRVVRAMCLDFGAPAPEKIHVDKIYELLQKGNNFEVDIPGNVAFRLENSTCFVTEKKATAEPLSFEYKLKEGFNEIQELNMAIAVTSDSNEDFSSNVYKISIQVKLSSAIIIGGLSVRNKRDGDSYYYGGMTRKLKKLFTDKKIPVSVREKTPILTDEKGIVWVPGFGVRDDSPETKTNIWITVYEKTV